MCIICVILVSVCLTVWPIPGSAEFYRYYDENGILRFTDNMAEVPEDQRPKVKRYEEERESPPAVQRTPEARTGQQQQLRDGSTGAVKKPEITSADDLTGVRDRLDEDFEELERRRTELRAERDTLTTPGEVRAYQEKVRALNEDIKLFDQRRQEFIKKGKGV